MNPLRLVIVDDERMVREGIRAMLHGHDDVVVVGEADECSSAMDVVAELQPDVVLVAVKLRNESGVELCRRLVRRHPGTPVIMLSSHEDHEDALAALRAGARGYLLKRVGPDALVSAAKAVRAGESVLDPELGGRLAMRLAADGSAANTPEPRRKAGRPAWADDIPADGNGNAYHLSARERQVLAHVSRGQSNSEIAKALFISQETVRSHVKSILRKLQAHDRSQAVAIALRSGLVE
jgi:DNA-binding NarL/FixJ family response regulator